jgi:hypothetical protein
MILNENQDSTTVDHSVAATNSKKINVDSNRLVKLNNPSSITHNKINSLNNKKHSVQSVKIVKSFYKKDAKESVTKSLFNLDENYENLNTNDSKSSIDNKEQGKQTAKFNPIEEE